ncbi:glycosyl transferase group 1 [Hymenobacter roseosalivarius DSM 11622]|uniref:Glycosyl transferase group 1 n=1 Tax=Hymenobacter roseosalivarius DSM 11622 TaxID=645990 RepID=A0A1W1V0Y7_9BACT|nr:glycosyltransferase family 4 protein [Hymenobacter roseosalivarius]SMB86962.1 glycosyl transferase group 1 [Hymenobacter roseosalivarius DSM 11622]
MHIAVFSQYHTNPDCPATSRHYTLLEHLARTHRVSLITTRTWEPQRFTQQFPWVPEGVEMRAADVPYHNKMGVGRRALAFGQYAAYALREGLRLDKPDVIWGISTPLTAAWAAAQVARLRRVPWVFEVQDLWPSFPIAMGAVPNAFARKQLFALEKSLYTSAKHILPLSPDMSHYIEALEISPAKITTVLNGTDFHLATAATAAAVASLREEQGLAGRRVVLYAGTFGRANDIPTLVAAAEKMAPSHPDVTWLFMGHGFHEPLIRAAAARCAGIRLIAPQPRHAVFTWFRLAEVSVVSFLNLPVLDANSPAKFYDSLAVGTPVIVTNHGWTKKWVEDYQCGWYTPAGDALTMASCISELLAIPATLKQAGEKGKTAALLHFDRNGIAANVQTVLEDAASITN